MKSFAKWLFIRTHHEEIIELAKVRRQLLSNAENTPANRVQARLASNAQAAGITDAVEKLGLLEPVVKS
jgi:hypothetical protein